MNRNQACVAFLIVAGLLTASTGLAAPQNPARGHLIGYIFDKDGTTPVIGAVLKLRNISSGAIYEAPAADKAGFFRVENLAKGIYNFGITTPAGDFNSNELVGIIENETTKLSISLNPYESEIRQSMQEIAREQSVKENEARIGRVVQYASGTKDALLFIEKGVLQMDDRIRVRGVQTNFYQDVTVLGLEGTKVKRALAGQNPWLRVVREAQPGDGVFLVCKKGVPPFFLSPCGIASVVGGVGALVGIVTVTDKNSVSPIK